MINSIGVSEAIKELMTEEYGCRITSDGKIEQWVSDAEQPTDDAIQKKIVELQAEWDAQEYARNRKEEYPPMEDQLDYMYHNGFEKWKTDMIDPVKDKYPKG